MSPPSGPLICSVHSLGPLGVAGASVFALWRTRGMAAGDPGGGSHLSPYLEQTPQGQVEEVRGAGLGSSACLPLGALR